MAYCYLIHFETKLGNPDNPRAMAQHYIGFCKTIRRRMADHRSGNGSKIMAAVSLKGIKWECVRTWPDGTRKLEKQLKRQHNAARFCPVCRGNHD